MHRALAARVKATWAHARLLASSKQSNVLRLQPRVLFNQQARAAAAAHQSRAVQSEEAVTR